MSERAYTVRELDALRQAVENQYLYGVYDLDALLKRAETRADGTRMIASRGYSGPDKDKAVEERVRTHMLAGHTAEDLINSEKLP